MKKSKMIAVSAMFVALGVVMLALGSVFEVLDLTLVSVSALFIVAAVIELRGSYPLMIYFATAVLALLICPTKVVALEYIMFGGLYPIFKAKFERYHPVVTWTLKLSFFNTVLLLFILISKYLMHLELESIGFTLATLALGNVYFIMLDILLSRLITLYLVKLRKRLKIGDFFAP